MRHEQKAHGDLCPSCKKSRLAFYPGYAGGDHPLEPAKVFCPREACAAEFRVDVRRVIRRTAAERVIAALTAFANPLGDPVAAIDLVAKSLEESLP